MKVIVPLIRQEKNSSDCGIVCIAMILKYYGIKKSIEEIKKDVDVFKGVGTYMPQLGSYFLSHNFDIEIVTMNPHLFNSSFKNASQKKIRTHLETLLNETTKTERKTSLKFFIDYMKSGGKITVKIPTIEDMKNELKHKQPLISLLTTQVLYKKKIGFNFHYQVITGVDKKSVLVNDPGAGLLGGKHAHDINDYLYALYASAYGETDNASIMKIRYKK